MALVEIYPNNMSGHVYTGNYFKEHSDYDSWREWSKDGDEIVVILDTETNAEAVYERLGGLLCLNERFGIYCNVSTNDEWANHNKRIRKMLVQEATAAGFPEECPKIALREYMVTIHRICNVSVMAENPEQAQRIGENLASKHTRFARDTIDNVMSECDDEFHHVSQLTENDRCNLSLDAKDSIRVLNEEE